MYINYREDTEKEMTIARDYETMIKMQMTIKNVVDDVICLKEIISDDGRYSNFHHVAVITNESEHIASINIIDTDTYKSVAKGCSVSAYGKLTNEKIKKDAIQLLVTEICSYEM